MKITITDKTLSAYIMLLAGLVFAGAGFAAPPLGEVSDSVLWLISQCFIYAGSVFGVAAYVDIKINERKNEIRRENRENA